MSSKEQLFWESMTFRQFAALMVRLQGLWMGISALDIVTYLPRYLTTSHVVGLDLSMALLRLLMYVVAGVGLFRHADALVRWTCEDWIRRTREPAPGVRIDP